MENKEKKFFSRDDKYNFLINYLINKNKDLHFENFEIPKKESEKWKLFRSLMNITGPTELSNEYINIQNDLLKELTKEKGIIDIESFTNSTNNLYIWKGDITRLKIDAIVNAANSGLTGCYSPCHNCIDNCIFSYAGLELRNYCNEIITKLGHPEDTGLAKISPGFNLPCKFIIHTVGPIVQGSPNENDKKLLESCYMSCLNLAKENKLKSIAFCCISTGVFCFPNNDAAKIAVATCKEFLKTQNYDIKIIFNVFKDLDLNIYNDLLKVKE